MKGIRKINEVTIWRVADVRACCIKHEYYTCGDNEDYGNMLDFVGKTSPTLENLYLVARDIALHSERDDYPLDDYIKTIMFDLSKEVVIRNYLFD